ncbi:NAD-dependent protein deacylase [Propionimicrobium sp. PCR01-08-3]|uniref:NAD-dependent protein deacylase n=1 Tax=Propionimicrobium sp. PCR01-08-3 TaxID=3052086 RepID=UPI00255C42B8|nr:NAD-dependent protein deacylase [Propionimicrobium sp. PCR01-08-3]WIY82726.1 NAD-dependent protein deacylase [Propionimicrobium sp. PCR01-08-3]
MTRTINDPLDTLTSWLAGSRSTVFFGGAGVSTASGIPDFRSAAGLYATQRGDGRSPEYMLSHECLVDEPEEFFKFHRTNLVHPDAKPNRAHTALAELEKAGRLAAVITQNIDGLHQMAGSKTVYELHGSVERNYCMGAAHHFYPLDEIPDEPVVPICPKCGAIVRPDVVLYGEMLDPATIDASIEAIERADVLIVGGTSLNVYPAAGLLQYYRGRKLALINLSTTPMDSRADLVIADRVDEVLGEVCDRVLQS